MRFAWVSFLVLVVVFHLSGCGGGRIALNSTGNPNPGGSGSGSGNGGGGVVIGSSPTDHVFLVVLENHAFEQVIGSPAMPYLNGLAKQHALAMNYFANTHPSIDNYFMLTVGKAEANNDDAFTGIVSDDNIVRALTGARKTWRAYMEDLPSVGYTGGDVNLYVKHHDPFTYLIDVLNSPQQTANIVPFTQLASDLKTGTLPAFGFVVPNIDDDAHDCPNGGQNCQDTDRLAFVDNWLKTNIDPLITNAAFANSVLIITWDESVTTDTANGGGHVATVLVGGPVKRGFKSTTFHQHQSILRLVLDLLRVGDLPNGAANAPQMTEFFQ